MKRILVVTPDGKTYRIEAEEIVDTSMGKNLQCIDKEDGKLIIRVGKDKNIIAVFKEWNYWVNLKYSECINLHV